jgi:hypothetical protein
MGSRKKEPKSPIKALDGIDLDVPPDRFSACSAQTEQANPRL